MSISNLNENGEIKIIRSTHYAQAITSQKTINQYDVCFYAAGMSNHTYAMSDVLHINTMYKDQKITARFSKTSVTDKDATIHYFDITFHASK